VARSGCQENEGGGGAGQKDDEAQHNDKHEADERPTRREI